MELFSCQTQHPTQFTFDKLNGDYVDISVRNDTFFYLNQPVAVYSNMELECLKNNCSIEISVNQFTVGFNDTTQMLMKFLHSQHPYSKIEIKVK
jgi:hypothetical protein